MRDDESFLSGGFLVIADTQEPFYPIKSFISDRCHGKYSSFFHLDQSPFPNTRVDE